MYKLTAKMDMTTGCVVSRRKDNMVTVSTSSSRYESRIGLLAHDCKQGDVLIFDPARNTHDIIVSGRVVVGVNFELDSKVYL